MELFLLAVKRNNNDYVPVDWTLSLLVENIELTQKKALNLYSLESIDLLTKNYTKEDLLNRFCSEGLIDEELKDKQLVIIFKNDDKYRELKQGVIFEEDKEALDNDYVYTFLINNLNNKEVLNWIYTYYKNKNKVTKYSDSFELFLQSISNFNNLTSSDIAKQLGRLEELPYIEQRSLGLLIKKKIMLRINKNAVEKPVSLKKEQ